jgi:Tol biopolymer transport system component
MGEVYRARDPRIGRDVAIKVLPALWSHDRDRLRRFEQEARAAGALSHPALLTIYDVGEQDGTPYLVSELLEGETLRTRLLGGPLSPRRAIDYAIEIARGLAVAHGRGIVHRDIKPENLFITKDGRVKILDFGLAKLRFPNERGSQGPTITHRTEPGAVMGTVGYMSPEQVRGDEVDERSDIFSLGAVLYEALAGKAPFKRDSSPETMTAILKEEPTEIMVMNPQVSPAVGRVVRRCLEKHPEARYQSASDLAFHLEDLSDSSARTSASAGKRRRVGRHLTWRAFVVTAVILLIVILGTLIASRCLRTPVRATAMKTVRLTHTGNVTAGAISPDGKYIAYSTWERGGGSLWLKQIATGTTMRLRAPSPANYLPQIAFSPDGNYIYYSQADVQNPGLSGSLNELPILGGEPRQVAAGGVDCFAISPDGKSAVVRRLNFSVNEYSIAVVSVDHGSERVVLRRRYPEVIGTALSWSSEQAVVFFGANVDREDRPFLSELDLTNGQVKPITKIDWPGRHWFRAPTSLVAVPDGSGWIVSNIPSFSATQIWLVLRNGAPRQITSDVASYSTVTMTADGRTIAACHADPSTNLWIASADGSAPEHAVTAGVGNAYGIGGARWLSDAEVMFTDAAEGKALLRSLNITTGTMRELTSGVVTWRFAISPDRSHLAFISDASGFTEVWTSGIDGGNARQLSHDLAVPSAPSWFPDSRSVAYASAGKVSAAWKRSIDQHQAVRLTNAPASIPEISPDGTSLLCHLEVAAPGTWKTALLNIAGNGRPRYFDFPRFAGPGIRWMPDQTAYTFVDEFDGVQNIFMQPIRGGKPRPITHFQSRGETEDFDVSRDGKRIVLSRREPADDMVLIRDFR